MYYLEHHFQTRQRWTNKKGHRIFQDPPTQAAYIKTGTVFYEKNLAKSNAQTYHWYQHVPETENIINGYKYMYIRNS
jgi:hypothetical protein